VTAVGGRLHVDRNGVLRAEVPVSLRDPRAR